MSKEKIKPIEEKPKAKKSVDKHGLSDKQFTEFELLEINLELYKRKKGLK